MAPPVTFTGAPPTSALAEPLLPPSTSAGTATGDEASNVLVEERSEEGKKDIMLFITAPSNLPGNYQLEVNLPNGINNPVTVKVPRGGVLAGQTFRVLKSSVKHRNGRPAASAAGTVAVAVDASPASTDEDMEMDSVTSGKWKDGLCACLTYGLLDPIFCMPFCCVQLATAQVMTRLNLNWRAQSTSRIRKKPKTGHYTFMIVFIMVFVYYTLYYLTLLIQRFIPWTKDLLIVWAALLMLYTVRVVAKTRAHIRRRDRIPQRTGLCACRKCEDCWCALCCTWCVVAQMARHTANLKRLPLCSHRETVREDDADEEYDISSCLSPNGLWRKPPSRESSQQREGTTAARAGDGNASPLHEPLLASNGDGTESRRRRKAEQVFV